MTESKENIRTYLISVGREIVESKGMEYLTARKLSEASGCSVGTIYNQFSNMDNLVAAINLQTLKRLYDKMAQVKPDRSAYKNLNTYLDIFVSFVLQNSNLWFLLYNYHLSASKQPQGYRAMIIRMMQLWQPSFDAVYTHLNARKRKVARQVLWLSLFAMSSFLTTTIINDFRMVNKKNLCKLLLNTYLAGLAVLKRG